MTYRIGEKVVFLGRESKVLEVDKELQTMKIKTSCGLIRWIRQSDV